MVCEVKLGLRYLRLRSGDPVEVVHATACHAGAREFSRCRSSVLVNFISSKLLVQF